MRVAKCGTPSGWMRHHRNNEPKCEPCKHAWNSACNARKAAKRSVPIGKPCMPVTPEQLETAQRFFDDGASQKEVHRTTGLSRTTLQKYFPGQRWTDKQGGEHRYLMRKAKVAL